MSPVARCAANAPGLTAGPTLAAIRVPLPSGRHSAPVCRRPAPILISTG